MEITERVPRDELNRLLVMTKPTGGAPPIVAGTIEDALHLATTPRRHARPESVVAAILPPIPPPKPKRMRAPTLVGTAPVIAATLPKPIVVVPPPVIAVPAPIVAIAPAAVAARVLPHRFALAAMLYAVVLFVLLAAF